MLRFALTWAGLFAGSYVFGGTAILIAFDMAHAAPRGFAGTWAVAAAVIAAIGAHEITTRR